MKKMLKNLLTIDKFSLATLWLFFLAVACHAQEGDSRRVQLNNQYKQIAVNLEKLYQNGELEEVINIFKQTCLESNSDLARATRKFRKVKDEFQADIYSVVSRTYIALDRPELADRFLTRLFAIRVDEDFQDYWQSIRETKEYDYYVAPRLQIGTGIGTNFALPVPMERFSVFSTTSSNGTNDYRSMYYGLNNLFRRPEVSGFRFGAQAMYSLTKNIGLTVLFSSSSIGFGYLDTFFWIDSPTPTVNLSIRTERNSFHTITGIDIPFLLRYYFLNKHKLQPYLLGGGFYTRRILASKILKIKEFPAVEVNGMRQDLLGNASNANIDITELIKPNHYGLMIGTGINYAYQYFRFSFSATYRYGINNIVVPANRYNNQDLVFGYHDIFDNIRLDQLNLQVGVSYVLNHKAFKK
jgi:hypothetical protein